MASSASQPPPAIEVCGVSRDYGKLRAVDGLSLTVPRGELFGFLGPNGAGKTTTLRMLNGLLRPTAGTLAVEGHDVFTGADTVRRITGLVPDTPPLYEYLTGWQYAAFVTSLYDVDPAQRDAEIARLFDLFELTEARDHLCKGYSHGMRKKLHIAAVLATRPRVLFLDEPTTGLDPRSSHRLETLLRELTDGGVTVFLTTHLLHLAQKLCDRVGIIAGGRLVADGSVGELRARRGDASLEEVFLRLTEDGPTQDDVEAPAG